MISVESTAETIHVHIPRAEVSDSRLAQILSGLPLETVAAERATRVGCQRVDEILARVPAAPRVPGDE